MTLDRSAPLVSADAPQRPDNMRGLVLMGLAFFSFAAADAQAKFLTESFHPLQVTWSRQLGLLAGVLVLLAMKGPGVLATDRLGLQVVRGLLAVFSAAAFIVALRYVPLANAVAVTFVAPFLVTVLGALLLGEKVGVRRWSAVAVGFIGTLIVIRPGFATFHPAVLVVLAAATAFASRQILSRRLASSDRTATTVAYTALVSVVVLSLPLPFIWESPETGLQLAVLAGMTICAGLGEFLVIKALETGQAIVLAPMHYTLIVYATFYGWLIFDQLPDAWTWTGVAIIVATGLYIMNRERRLARAP